MTTGIVNNRVTLSRWIKQAGFPRGVLLGPNTRAWTEDEIEQWLKSRPTDGYYRRTDERALFLAGICGHYVLDPLGFVGLYLGLVVTFSF